MRLIELWHEAGKKPFKARQDFWGQQAWFFVQGFSPVGRKEAFGYTESGNGRGASNEAQNWVFAETPERKKGLFDLGA
jgi:hypothetical protein